MEDLLAVDGMIVAPLIPLVVCIILAFVLSIIIQRAGVKLLEDEEQAQKLARTSFSGIVAAGVLLAVGRLVGREATDEALSDSLGGIVRGLPGVIAAFVLVIGALLVAGFMRATLIRMLGAAQPRMAKVVGAVAYWAIVILVSLIALEGAGMETGILEQLLMLIAGGGVFAAALALGLGTRDVIAGVAAGRHVDQILEAGDHVVIGEIEGMVVGVGHASVRVETARGSVEVPNTAFLTAPARVIPRLDG